MNECLRGMQCVARDAPSLQLTPFFLFLKKKLTVLEDEEGFTPVLGQLILKDGGLRTAPRVLRPSSHSLFRRRRRMKEAAGGGCWLFDISAAASDYFEVAFSSRSP